MRQAENGSVTALATVVREGPSEEMPLWLKPECVPCRDLGERFLGRGDSSAKVQRPDEVGVLRNKKNLVARTQRCGE